MWVWNFELVLDAPKVISHSGVLPDLVSVGYSAYVRSGCQVNSGAGLEALCSGNIESVT